MANGEQVIVAFPNGDDWRLVDTGLRGSLDVMAGGFVIPIRDEMTAEDVARILTGTFKRETAESGNGNG